jgi:hypothetical protein
MGEIYVPKMKKVSLLTATTFLHNNTIQEKHCRLS